jgi:hypothetical protein
MRKLATKVMSKTLVRLFTKVILRLHTIAMQNSEA